MGCFNVLTCVILNLMRIVKGSRRRRLVSWKSIRALVLDFDGVMTDGYVYINQNGEESVRCSRRDGLGIDMMRTAEVKVCVLSREKNLVVQKRCEKLKIECRNGIEDKVSLFKKVAEDYGLKLTECCYMGDDLIDIACIRSAGVGVAVADAHPKAKMAADYVTQACGGTHAVREVCEIIYHAKNRYADETNLVGSVG